MMSRKLDYSADEIPFDFAKESRVSLSDARDIIVIDIDRVGDGYRAIINGCEFELPPGIGSIDDAKKVALSMAIAHISQATKQLIDENF
jgi:hypothetical protein